MIRSVYKYNRVYLGGINAVLFDLGGTVVDKYSLSPLHALDMTFQNTGVVLDAKKEALRIRKNKSLGQKINSTPSPAIEKNSGKSVLIK